MSSDDEDIRKLIGSRIAIARKAAGLNQEELAAAVGAYEKNGELHQYRHPRGYPTRYLHCKGIEKLVCCRWNVPEIAISGVCKIPDGRLAVSPSNARKRGTPCQGAPLER